MTETGPELDSGEETEKICWQCGRTFTTSMEVCPDDGARLIAAEPEDQKDPLVGTLFDGRFRILKKLGEGGMGAVYSARRMDFESDVALKVLKRDFTTDEQIRKRFMYEARVIASLKHPHAIQVYDFGESDDGDVYMVMELLEGESLADRLAHRFVTYREVFDIIPPVCGVLGEAHVRDVIHRDLKPENIYLLEVDGNEEFPKLLDFGIAKHHRAETMTKSGTLWGTPAYMSPEQARGDAVAAEADIYGIGIMLFELITGNLPFSASTQMGYAVKHINAPVRPPSSIPGLDSIPEELDEFIVRMLEKDPDDRPERMEVVAETLERICDEYFDDEVLDTVPAQEVDPIGLQRWMDDAPDVSGEVPVQSAPGQDATNGESPTVEVAEDLALGETVAAGETPGDISEKSEEADRQRELSPTADASKTETRQLEKKKRDELEAASRAEGDVETRMLQESGEDRTDALAIGGLSSPVVAVLLLGGLAVIAGVAIMFVEPDSADVEANSATVPAGAEGEEPIAGTPQAPLDEEQVRSSAMAEALDVFRRSYQIVHHIEMGEDAELEGEADYGFLHGSPEIDDEEDLDEEELEERRRLREALEQTF